MPPTDPTLRLISPLNAIGARFMITGSVAATFYGEPRNTNDVDIILFLKSDLVQKLIEVFPEEEFYLPPIDVIQVELARRSRGHFNIIDLTTGFKADIYLVASDPLHLWGLSHLRTIDLDGTAIPLAPPEYVIIRKLQFFREGQSEKHLRDIRRMLTMLGDSFNRSQLIAFISEHHLNPEWERAQNSSD